MSETVVTETLTADEVAGLLRLDRKTVYEYAARGKIPCRRIGKRFLFSRTRVMGWLQGEDRDPRTR